MERTKILTGSGLKCIAMVSMLLDHLGAVLIYGLLSLGSTHASQPTDLHLWCIKNWQLLYGLYWALRKVGRFAFPIYCFLLVEGFRHTRSVPKYALRLAVFCLISEIPFDLAFNNALLEWQSNNVFFTLLTGLLCIWGIDRIHLFLKTRSQAWLSIVLVSSALIASGCFLAEHVLNSDYGYAGVLAIVLLYLFRQWRIPAFAIAVGVLCLPSSLEFWAFWMLIPIYFYNGQRGAPMKMGPYLFYPAHLLVLYAITATVLSLCLPL